ncbi:MAG: glycosyltransferase, partial [Ignavibacteriae bacterium]|nr:glycosyltransferase [Ignavibacteriota bacterium]
MIYDIFQILLWVTAIMLVITGLDDMYMDLLYWIYRKKYKAKMPDFNEMFDKAEKPIAVILGAWRESSVIGRTLSYAIRNLKYKNYRFFVGVYPNDPDTIRIVKEISKKDSRVIACINPQNGPSTKADNLNSLYAGLCEYEKVYGEFEVILVHDAEDFMHPFCLKLYNYLIGYKGYHGVQIPVIPIKSKLGGIFHRTYCDAFAEVHTKDMIVREAMDTFIPFSGTGMGFHRKAIYYLVPSRSGG